MSLKHLSIPGAVGVRYGYCASVVELWKNGWPCFSGTEYGDRWEVMSRYCRRIPDSIRVNLLDQTFGQLTVIGFGGRSKGQTMWVCRCSCGYVAKYHAGNLRAGRSSRCVQCQLDALQHTKKNFSHGYSNTSTYRAWTGTRRYGRCKRWEKFENFLADMGERPPSSRLVRLNRKRPYSKANAVWRTPAETLKEDIDRTLEALISAGVVAKSQGPSQRRRLRQMTRQARYQLRLSVNRGRSK